MAENEAWSKKRDILKRIDEATAPSEMSKRAAITWLEELEADLEGRIEALEEEIKGGRGVMDKRIALDLAGRLHIPLKVWQERPREITWLCSCGCTNKHWPLPTALRCVMDAVGTCAECGGAVRIDPSSSQARCAECGAVEESSEWAASGASQHIEAL